MGIKQRYFSPYRLSSEFDLVHSVVEWQDAKHIFTSDLKIIYHYSLCMFTFVQNHILTGRNPSSIVIVTVKHPLSIVQLH